MNAYVDRLNKAGDIALCVLLPGEDGGTGHRWSAAWTAPGSEHADIDASGETLELALHSLAYGIAEELVELRALVETMK